MRFILLLIFSIFATLDLTAQQQYLFSHLHSRDGLASEIVNSVQQDEKGFIWIATNNGLQRYDGKNFLTFQHKEGDKNSLPYSRITWIKKDARNRLWLLIEDNRIGYFNTNNFNFHEVPIRTSADDLHKLDGRLFIDSLGNIIFMLSTGGIYTYNEQHDEFASSYNPFTLPKNWEPIWLAYNHQYKTYWISCDSGLVKYNVKKKTLSYRNHNADNDSIINAFSSSKVLLQLWQDKSGMFWLVSWEKGLAILSYDSKTNTKHEWQSSIYKQNRGWYFEPTSIYEQQNGDVWFTGLNLFARFNRNKNDFDFMRDNLPGEFSLHYDDINSIFEDREHNIWICSNKGLYRFNPSAQLINTYFNHRYDKDTTVYPNVSDFIQLKNGDFIVCTWGNGLFGYDSAINPIHRNYLDQSIQAHDGMVWCIHQRKNGDIWRGIQIGYLSIYFDSAKTTKVLRPDIINHSTIRQIEEDSSGDLWLGMQSGLIVKWKAASNEFVKMNKFSSPVHRLYVDKQNNIWVCLRNQGVFKLSSVDGKILSAYSTTAPQGKRLMLSGANDILQYNDSLFLIASGGVNVLNIHNNSIRFIDPKNNTFTNTVTNLVLDKNGVLWIASTSGLYSMNMQTEVVTRYDESQGIQPAETNEGSSYVLKDGRIALGRNQNFIIFDPAKIKATNVTPDVRITGFKLMNKSLLTDSLFQLSSIDFPYNTNAVTIQFSTLTYQNNYPIFYKLEGLDKNWKTAENNEAVYNYIPPGTYTFQVYAENTDGVKSKKITALTFTIAAPFWGTWWFYCLLALLVVALLFWYDKERMQRKAALQLMRSSISDNLHTEVNNALQDINILSEIATIKADREPVQSKNYISEINYKSRNMITVMDDMLWSINPANDTMQRFVTRAKEFAASISYSKSAVVHIQSDKHVSMLKPDMKLRYELMLIYKTSLNWLVNEMQSKNTTVQLNYINSQLQLNMFADDVSPRMQEVNIIEKKLKERATIINAVLDVLVEEKGTAIVLSVKM